MEGPFRLNEGCQIIHAPWWVLSIVMLRLQTERGIVQRATNGTDPVATRQQDVVRIEDRRTIAAASNRACSAMFVNCVYHHGTVRPSSDQLVPVKVVATASCPHDAGIQRQRH